MHRGEARREIGAFERTYSKCCHSNPILQTKLVLSTGACREERGIPELQRGDPHERRFVTFGAAVITAIALILTVVLMCLPQHVIPPLPVLPQLSLWLSSARLTVSPASTPHIQNPAWDNLKGAEHCLRYATRQYTARLINLPTDVPALRACRETPANIHGIDLVPHFCEDLGMSGGVWGYWIIDFEEPACLTSWSPFVDKGCDERGSTFKTRRFEALLEKMQDGDSWLIMCATTPADLKGFHFPSPTMCERWGRDALGVWEVDDLTCAPSASET